jgi:hypothetical protein
VLPERFRKIREYGWMRGEEIKSRRDRLLEWFARQREFALALTKLLANLRENDVQAESPPCHCPECKNGLLAFVQKILPEKIPNAAYG